MTTRPVIHAPDGGMFGHSLCENPQGDVTDYEQHVDCPDCLDALDRAAEELRQRMRDHGFQFRAARASGSAPEPSQEDRVAAALPRKR